MSLVNKNYMNCVCPTFNGFFIYGTPFTLDYMNVLQTKYTHITVASILFVYVFYENLNIFVSMDRLSKSSFTGYSCVEELLK